MKKLLPRFVVFLSLLTLWPQLFAATVANELYLTKRNSANTANQQVVIQSDTGKFLRADGTAQTISGGGNMLTTSNLSDLASAATSRTNLGVYSKDEVAGVRNALAPAQALSFNGTAGSTLTLASVPSGDQTWAFDVDIPASNPSATVGIFNVGGAIGAARTLGCYFISTGQLNFVLIGASGSDYRGATIAGFVSTYAGTRVRCIATMTSGVFALYVNGQVVTTSSTTGGTPPAWGDALANGTVYLGKLDAAQYYFSGAIRLLGIENYVLSPAQQTYLFQTGSFPASDFGQGVNDSGTTVYAGASMINGANSTFASDSGWWTKGGTASIAAGVCTIPAYSSISHNAVLTVGKRYRCTVNVVSVSGGIGIWDGAAIQSTWTTTGAKTIDFTASGTQFMIGSSAGTGSGSIDDVTLAPLGLLVAPDPTQLGSGTSWYDVSGNSATITLGSGVEWVNKWSNYIPGSPTITGNLTAAGTGTHLFSGSLGLAYAGTQKWHLTGTTGGDLLFTRSGIADRMTLSSDGALSGMVSVGIASTSAIKGVRTATGTYNFGTIAANSYGQTTVSVTGAVAGDSVVCTPSDDASANLNIIVTAWVSSANTVKLAFFNPTGSGVVVGAANFRVTVTSF